MLLKLLLELRLLSLSHSGWTTLPKEEKEFVFEINRLAEYVMYYNYK